MIRDRVRRMRESFLSHFQKMEICMKTSLGKIISLSSLSLSIIYPYSLRLLHVIEN